MSATGTMSVGISPAINRRSLLIGAASAAAVVSLPAAAKDFTDDQRAATFHSARPLAGCWKTELSTDVWTYGGRLPGPEIGCGRASPSASSSKTSLSRTLRFTGTASGSPTIWMACPA